MYINKTKIKVRYNETDQMGVVHHANYYSWFEVGRTEFMEAINMPYNKMEEKGVLLPVIESHCKYKKPAKYEDEIIIKTWIKRIKGVRSFVCYEILKQSSNETLAIGQTVHVFANNNFKPINLKKVNNDMWKKLYEVSEERSL